MVIIFTVIRDGVSAILFSPVCIEGASHDTMHIKQEGNMSGGKEPGFPEGEDMRQTLFDKVCGTFEVRNSKKAEKRIFAVGAGDAPRGGNPLPGEHRPVRGKKPQPDHRGPGEGGYGSDGPLRHAESHTLPFCHLSGSFLALPFFPILGDYPGTGHSSVFTGLFVGLSFS